MTKTKRAVKQRPLRAVELTCTRCGHTWIPRVQRPRKCPNPPCQAFLGEIPAKK